MYTALIKTHHITSRKKIAKLKKAAEGLSVYALLRVGGTPGVMYVEGSEEAVKEWVGTVHELRYKDYQLIAKPTPRNGSSNRQDPVMEDKGLHEVDSVKEFGERMNLLGVLEWWRRAMGYIS